MLLVAVFIVLQRINDASSSGSSITVRNSLAPHPLSPVASGTGQGKRGPGRGQGGWAFRDVFLGCAAIERGRRGVGDSGVRGASRVKGP